MTMEWYEPEVRELIERLAARPVAEPAVFYGSSSLRLWETLAEDLGDARAVNAAFGGSTLEACAYYFGRIVPPLGPASLVVYAGDNDLGDGRSPDDVLASFRRLTASVDNRYLNTTRTKVERRCSAIPARQPFYRIVRSNRFLLDRVLTDSRLTRFDIPRTITNELRYTDWPDERKNQVINKGAAMNVLTSANHASITITFCDDAREAHSLGESFLTRRPVLQTLLLSLLESRVRLFTPSNYWIAAARGKTVGFALQSPNEPAVLSVMPAYAVKEIAQSMHSAGKAIPGVCGEARNAALFAAEWAELSKVPAVVSRVSRLYEADEGKQPPTSPGGRFRLAGVNDRDQIITWARAFVDEVGTASSDVEAVIDERIADQALWVWDDRGLTSMAANWHPVAGVSLVSLVYTPPKHRGRGFAHACVASLTDHMHARGIRCALFADLANPMSNAIYRKIGYRPVAEFLMFAFKPTSVVSES
jgi:predicted GNAT superfamily acetyltransferase